MTQVAIHYAGALYALAAEENLTDTVLAQLKALDAGIGAEPQFIQLLTAPNITKEERCAVLDDCFRSKVHPYVLNFLKILTENGYARHFSDCCKAYEAQYDRENGIVTVCAVTAVPLTQEQARRLTEKLSATTGKTVQLDNRIDPECLGGVKLRYDGKQVDGTVKNRLDTIAALLKDKVG